MALKFVPKHIIALQCAGDARPVHIKVSGFVCVSPDCVFCLADVMSTHRVQTVLEHFSDTFEQNRANALAVLSSLPRECLHLQVQDTYAPMY